MALYLKKWCSHFAVQPDGSIRTITDEQWLIESGRMAPPVDTAWRETPAARSMLGVLGAYGCATKAIEDEERFLEIVRMAFGVKGDDVSAVCLAMAYMPKATRKMRLKQAVKMHWPKDYDLFPREAACRRWL